MKSYSVDAFVLRMRPLGEADRVLTLFSRERGKLNAVAKGVRKVQSKFGARLDFMTRSALALHIGRSLDVITGARLVGAAWSGVVEPDAYALASYAAESIDGLCEPDLPVPELFDLLVEFQAVLAQRPPSREAQMAAAAARTRASALDAMRAVMDLRMLDALGFAPELDACVRCGSALGHRPFAGGRAALSPEAGGLVCRRCLEAGSADAGEMRRAFDLVRLTSAQFELLRRARELSLDEAAQMPELASVAHATQAFVQHHLGRASKSLAAAGVRR